MADPTQLTDDDVRRMLANPMYAIEIHPMMAEPHPTIVTEDQWIGASLATIKEEGAEAFLRTLLDVLKVGA